MKGAWDLDWWTWVINFSWPNSQYKVADHYLTMRQWHPNFDPYEASIKSKLWAVITRSEFAWSFGICKLILESKFFVVVNLIAQQDAKLDSNYALVTKAQEFLGRDWTVRIHHTNRLTRVLISRDDFIVREAPTRLYLLLYYDLIGSVFLQLI
jgi:hypothetical protein